MALFAVTLSDQTTDFVEGADAYQQEGPLTTFFSFQENRQVIDSWSSRLASYRTADITAIRRSAPPGIIEQDTDLINQDADTHEAELAQPELSVA